jgi:hypothetical protein
MVLSIALTLLLHVRKWVVSVEDERLLASMSFSV